MVTRLVAIGATVVAVVAGVAFAQQSASTGSDDSVTTNDGTDTGTDTGTGSSDGGSGWSGPSVTSPDDGSSHGSTGGS